jgi:cardiolipin synthase
MLDPVADKILLSSSFVALTWGPGLKASIPAWLTVVTLSRDAIIVMSVAIINLTLGRRMFYPSLLGKACTGAQLLTVALVLLENALPVRLPGLRYIFILALVLTVSSALHYVYLASARKGGAPAPGGSGG